MKVKLVSLIIIFCIFIFSVISCGINDDESSTASKTKVNKEEVSEISILCVGDIMAHKPQYESAYNSKTDSYSFDENYNYVREYISQADLALCNVETVFADKEPCGYPVFNAPDELADAIKNAGFDVAITSNNHMLDQGTEGVDRSIQVLNEAGLSTVGSVLTEEENRYIIKNVNGVKVGIVAYTYETTGSGTTPSLNGNAIPEDVVNRICSFNPDTWQTDITEIKENVSAAKVAGADITICYFHWGEEYQSQPMEYQVNMANDIAANTDVDVIFASHPHVLEPAVTIAGKGGKTVPVFYSMGNFISNQRSETLGESRRNTEDGMIAQVKFEITKIGDEVTTVELQQATALPTWVNRYKPGSTWSYYVIPLDNNYGENKSLMASGNTARADESIVDSLNIIGSNYERDSEGNIIIYDRDAQTENSENYVEETNTDLNNENSEEAQ